MNDRLDRRSAASIAAVSKHSEHVAGRLAESIADSNRRFDALSKHSEHVAGRLAESIGEANRRFDSLEQRTASLKHNLAELRQQLDGLDGLVCAGDRMNTATAAAVDSLVERSDDLLDFAMLIAGALVQLWSRMPGGEVPPPAGTPLAEVVHVLADPASRFGAAASADPTAEAEPGSAGEATDDDVRLEPTGRVVTHRDGRPLAPAIVEAFVEPSIEDQLKATLDAYVADGGDAADLYRKFDGSPLPSESRPPTDPPVENWHKVEALPAAWLDGLDAGRVKAIADAFNLSAGMGAAFVVLIVDAMIRRAEAFARRKYQSEPHVAGAVLTPAEVRGWRSIAEALLDGKPIDATKLGGDLDLDAALECDGVATIRDAAGDVVVEVPLDPNAPACDRCASIRALTEAQAVEGIDYVRETPAEDPRILIPASVVEEIHRLAGREAQPKLRDADGRLRRIVNLIDRYKSADGEIQSLDWRIVARIRKVASAVDPAAT
jgi:hypothetical protein